MKELNFTFQGHKVLFYDVLSSTNTVLKEIVSENNAVRPLALLTNYQNAGRGQRGNSWQSLPGEDMLLSMYFPLSLPISALPAIQMRFILEMRQFLLEYLDGHILTEYVQLKWPNDMIIHNKKIAGILIESSLQNEIVSGVYIGVGFNILKSDFTNLPNASSLDRICSSKKVDRTQFIQSFLDHFETVNFHHLSDTIHIQFNEYLFRRGHFFFSAMYGRVLIVGVQSDGSLLIETEDNEIHTIRSSYEVDWNMYESLSV